MSRKDLHVQRPNTGRGATNRLAVQIDGSITHLGNKVCPRDHRHPDPFQYRIRVNIEVALVVRDIEWAKRYMGSLGTVLSAS